MRPTVLRSFAGGVVVLALAGSVAMTASAAPPKQTGNPTLQPGNQPYVSDTISVSNGSWANNPTKYTYRWYRCNATGDRQGCTPIPGATSQSYTVQKADANHKLDAIVTATNADGSASSDAQSQVVLDNVAPTNSVRPTITGTPMVGETLTATNGTWNGAASYSYEWQQCDEAGNSCVTIAGATGKTYGVRSSDVGHRLRVRVTARNKYGSASAVSNNTALVTSGTQTTTTVVTVPSNKAPTIAFISLKRVGTKVYARVSTCDDNSARLTVTERDSRSGVATYTRRFAVDACGGTYVRSWRPVARFRHHTLVVSLQSKDGAGRVSRIVRRTVRMP